MAGHGASRTKITALNDACLEKVMMNLSFVDLTNMAVSNSRFTENAAYVYRRKYADQVVRFDSLSSTPKQARHFWNILKAFGESIRRLHVNFNSERDQDARDRVIFMKINRTCSKSVVELRLSFVRHDMVFTHAFTHLRHLMIADSYFSRSMASNLAQHSPNLTSLELHNVKNVFNKTFAGLHFPSLVHFAKFNEVAVNPELEMENLQNFRDFLNINPQITSFGVGSIEMSYMLKYKLLRQQFFNEMHPNVPCPDKRDLITYLFPFEPVYKQNVNHFHIRLDNTYVGFLRDLRHRNIQFTHLPPIEHIELHADELPLHVADFVAQFRMLKTLQIFVRNLVKSETIVNFFRTAHVFPQLTDFEFIVVNNKQYLDLSSDFMPTVGEILANRRKMRSLTIGFEVPQTLDAQDKIRKFQMDLQQQYAKHFPQSWRIAFSIQTIDIQRKGTENVAVLGCILTNTLIHHQ